MAHHVGGVDESALGTPHADGLADGQRSHVLGDVAGRVRLDEQVEVAGLVVARDGGVGPDNLLGRAIGLLDISANGDVLANGETQDRGRRRQGEPVAGRCKLLMLGAKLRRMLQRGSEQRVETNMATLWEMTVFSLSSNSWKASGLRTFLGSVVKYGKR